MNTTAPTLKCIISGGGTGGHIFPAIAIADALRAKIPGAEILFVGAKGKMEMERVPQAGYPIEGLWISGFSRKLRWSTLLFPVKLLSSLIKARRIIRRFQPSVAVGVGGYASGPLLEMASRSGVPCLIQEQNSYAGITNRLLGKKVDRICVAYEGMDRFFPKKKIILTGNPVRQDLTAGEVSQKEALDHFQLDHGKKTVLIFGGSQGARTLNQAVAGDWERIGKRKDDVQILWQVGKLYWEEYRESRTAKLPNVRVLPFIDRMDKAYALADLVVCRAGALTISELACLGKASLLVPSPNVAEDHQMKNAQALVDRDAARLVADRFAVEKMIREAFELLDHPQSLTALQQRIQKFARPRAATDIAEQVLELVNTTN